MNELVIGFAAETEMTTEQAAALEEVAILYYNEKTAEPIIQTREAHNEGRSQVKISRELAEGLRDLGYLGSHFHSFWLTAKGCEWAGDYWKNYRMSKLV